MSSFSDDDMDVNFGISEAPKPRVRPAKPTPDPDRQSALDQLDDITPATSSNDRSKPAKKGVTFAETPAKKGVTFAETPAKNSSEKTKPTATPEKPADVGAEVQIELPKAAKRRIERVQKKQEKRAQKIERQENLDGAVKQHKKESANVVEFVTSGSARRAELRRIVEARKSARAIKEKFASAEPEAIPTIHDVAAKDTDKSKPRKPKISLTLRTDASNSQTKEKHSKKREAEVDPDAPKKAKKSKSGETFAKDVAKSRVMGRARDTTTESARELLGSKTFSAPENGLDGPFERRLTELNFTTMTHIQQLALNPLKNGEDALLRAATGSGKTLAFSVPLVQRLLTMGRTGGKLSRADGTRLIVLSPTKELCTQTMAVLETISRPFPWLVPGSVGGGEKRQGEKARLRKGITLLCATPGRLLDHLKTCASFKTDKLCGLVLDEADRLLDLGFEKQLREICGLLREKNSGDSTFQTVLASATLTPKVRALGEFCLKPDAAWLGVGRTGEQMDAATAQAQADSLDDAPYEMPATLRQWFLEVPAKRRLAALIASIRGKTQPRAGELKKAIVFFSSCDSVEFHYDLFLAAKWPNQGPKGLEQAKQRLAEQAKTDSDDENLELADAPAIFQNLTLHKLHGNLPVEERAGHMRDFAAATSGVLLTTDVAARGLDVPKVDWIIQYDAPQQVEEYMHRVGRTARLGQAGNALLFLQPGSELQYLDVLKDRGAVLSQLDLDKTMHFGLKGRPGHSQCPEAMKRLHDLPAYLTGALTLQVSNQEELQRRARAAFLAAQFSYRTFSRALKHIFDYSQLHLGHLAASYALREAPKQIAAKHKAAQNLSEHNKEKSRGKQHAKRNPLHNKPAEGVIKRDAKQGSQRSGRIRVKEAIERQKMESKKKGGFSKRQMRINARDEFAC